MSLAKTHPATGMSRRRPRNTMSRRLPASAKHFVRVRKPTARKTVLSSIRRGQIPLHGRWCWCWCWCCRLRGSSSVLGVRWPVIVVVVAVWGRVSLLLLLLIPRIPIPRRRNILLSTSNSSPPSKFLKQLLNIRIATKNAKIMRFMSPKNGSGVVEGNSKHFGWIVSTNARTAVFFQNFDSGNDVIGKPD